MYKISTTVAWRRKSLLLWHFVHKIMHRQRARSKKREAGEQELDPMIGGNIINFVKSWKWKIHCHSLIIVFSSQTSCTTWKGRFPHSYSNKIQHTGIVFHPVNGS